MKVRDVIKAITICDETELTPLYNQICRLDNGKWTLADLIVNGEDETVVVDDEEYDTPEQAFIALMNKDYWR